MNADEARRSGLGAMRGLVFVFLFYASLGLVALSMWLVWLVIR